MSAQDLHASGDNVQMPLMLSPLGDNVPTQPSPPEASMQIPPQPTPPGASMQIPPQPTPSTRTVHFKDNPISTLAVYIKQTDHRRLHKFADKEACYYFYDFKDPNSDGSSSESSESDVNTDNSDTVSESDSDSDDNSGPDKDAVNDADSGKDIEAENGDVQTVEEDNPEKGLKLDKVDDADTSASARGLGDDIDKQTELKVCSEDEGTDVDEEYRKACMEQPTNGHDVEDNEPAAMGQCRSDISSPSTQYRGWQYVMGGGVAAAVIAASAYTLYKWLK